MAGRALGAAALALASFCAPAVAAPGDLDPSFSADGQVLTDLGGDESATAVAIDPEGRIVVAGYSAKPAAGRTFAVARYLPNGNLDPSFSGNGIATTAFPGNDAAAEAIAIEPDGDLVVAGTGNRDLTGWDFAVARYRPNGTLDPGFGRNGRVMTDFAGDGDGGYGLALQGPRIVVAGESEGDFALARYRGNGILDPTFGGTGRVTTDFAGFTDVARAVTTLPDGTIVAVGDATERDRFGNPNSIQFGLAGYTQDGTLDSSFGGDGRVATDVGYSPSASSVVTQPGGKLLVGGSSSDDLVLARYRPHGSLDATFGAAGLVHDRSEGAALDIAVQPDGKIVAAGSGFNSSSENFELSRWRSDGTPDASFGWPSTDFGLDNDDLARGVAIEPDGKIVAVGRSAPGYRRDPGDFAIARYRVDSQGPPDRDADRVPDDTDQCPDRYATTHHGCPIFDSSLTLRYSDEHGAFTGRIRSRADVCRANREIAVYKVRRGRDLKIGVGYSLVPAPPRPGRYYARVTRDFSGHEVICGRARSRTIGLRQ